MTLPIDIYDLDEEQVKEILADIVSQLDELDSEDYFGSEGWRHMLGYED